MPSRGILVGGFLATLVIGGAAWTWLRPDTKIVAHRVIAPTTAVAPVATPPVTATPADAQPLPPVDTTSDRKVVIRALDKVTMRMQEFEMAMDQTVQFGRLSIRVRTCQANPPEQPPENAAFLQIAETKPDSKQVQLFSGWMYGSSPALNALEHPVYDVWVMACKMNFPDKGPDTVDVAAVSAVEKRGTGNADEDAVASEAPIPRRHAARPRPAAATPEAAPATADTPAAPDTAAPVEGATDN